MQERIELQKKLVLDLNERSTQYSIMAREVETNKAIYQSLLERVQRNRIHGGRICQQHPDCGSGLAADFSD